MLKQENVPIETCFLEPKKKHCSFGSNRETILTELVQALHLRDDGRELVRIRPGHLIPLICAHSRVNITPRPSPAKPRNGTKPARAGAHKRDRGRSTADEVLHGEVPRPQHPPLRQPLLLAAALPLRPRHRAPNQPLQTLGPESQLQPLAATSDRMGGREGEEGRESERGPAGCANFSGRRSSRWGEVEGRRGFEIFRRKTLRKERSTARPAHARCNHGL